MLRSSGNWAAKFATRLNAAKGPVRILVPLEGFSEHTKRRATDLAGNDKGPWKRPEEYQLFMDTLKSHLKGAPIEELRAAHQRHHLCRRLRGRIR